MDGRSVRVDEGKDGSRTVRTAVARAEGEVLLRLSGTRQAQAGRHTLQLVEHEHLAAPTEAPAPAWIFLTHSCAPITYVRDLTLVALRDLAEGEALTFNYNTTEYELAEPFECHCATCPPGHLVRGYKHLSAAERETLAPMVAPFLRAQKASGSGSLVARLGQPT